MRYIGADPRGRVQCVELRRVADNQMNVAVDPPVFMFAHLIGENARGVVVLRIRRGAGWAADILPVFSSIAAARYTTLFDADEDFRPARGRPR